MLMASNNNQLVSAKDADEQHEYFCPICKQKVILKRGMINCPHFAHHKNSDCIVEMEDGESQEHLLGKQQIKEFIGDKNVDVEKYFAAIKQRPDLLYKHLAFEFQCSPISFERLKERINGYKRIHLKSLWILGGSLSCTIW